MRRGNALGRFYVCVYRVRALTPADATYMCGAHPRFRGHAKCYGR